MTDETIDAIRFTAQVAKIQTMVDGGIRLTLDLLPPTTNESVMELMEARKPGIILECAAVAVKPEKEKAENAGNGKKIHI